MSSQDEILFISLKLKHVDHHVSWLLTGLEFLVRHHCDWKTEIAKDIMSERYWPSGSACLRQKEMGREAKHNLKRQMKTVKHQCQWWRSGRATLHPWY